MNQKQQTASEAAFLDRLVATAQACNVYLNSSVKLVGVIEGFSSQDGVIWLRPHSGWPASITNSGGDNYSCRS
jgi:hypothetical protein